MKRRTLLAIAAGSVVLLSIFGAVATVASVELLCTTSAQPQDVAPSPFQIDDVDYRRAAGDSYLTYPEWNIVHAYEDLAGVMQLSSESGFRYTRAISNFWKSLCSATRVASDIGPVSMDQKVTNYVIGFSFTAEMALQGGLRAYAWRAHGVDTRPNPNGRR